ncbi:MAG: response regulator transcription factor [Planctomycetota bacterium]|nr:response regulator transcription factor [Planctomycetota bacterium]
MIVDDHPLVRFGLRQLISDETSLEICGEAESPAQALDLIASLNPDIVVVDISLKDGNGIGLEDSSFSIYYGEDLSVMVTADSYGICLLMLSELDFLGGPA